MTIVGDGPEKNALEITCPTDLSTHQCSLDYRWERVGTIFSEQANLFVLPGTGGLAVQQAMSYALPVIVAEG